MNYIALLNRYWQLHKQQGFTPGDTHLYACLLSAFSAKGSKSDWPETIQWTDGAMAELTGSDVKAVDRARERLIDRGLIQVVSFGQGSRAGKVYRLAPDDTFFDPSTSAKKGEVKGEVNSSTSGKKGEVASSLLPELPPQPLPQHPSEKEKSLLYKEFQTLNRETEDLNINNAEGEILEVDAVEMLPDDQKKEPNPVARPPSQMPGPRVGPCRADEPQDGLTDEDRQELDYFTQKLQTNSRLLYKLSLEEKLKGPEATSRIQSFVIDQWSAKNLTSRNDTELTMHCQRWIHEQLKKENNDHEQRQSKPNNRAQKGHQQDRAEDGAEIDRIAERYFRNRG